MDIEVGKLMKHGMKKIEVSLILDVHPRAINKKTVLRKCRECGEYKDRGEKFSPVGTGYKPMCKRCFQYAFEMRYL